MKKDRYLPSWREDLFLFLLIVLVYIAMFLEIIVFPFKWILKKLGLIKPEKSKFTKFRKSMVLKCSRCGELFFIQANRRKQFGDDWESDCFVCFNPKCPVYGRPFIVVYEPFSSRPYSKLPEERDPVIFRTEDPNVAIINLEA